MMRHRLIVFIFGLIFFALSASPAWARIYSSEQEFWSDPAVYPKTYIIHTEQYSYLDRNAMAQNLDIFRNYGFDIDENFVWFSYEQSYRVSDYSDREWAFINGAGNLDWKKLGDLFEPDVNLSVFAYGSSFVSRVCGNFSPAAENPPPPTISGYKWDDLNENGVWDEGEPGISDWTIILSKDGSEVARTKTDGNGYYEFAIDARPSPIGLGVTPGIFELAEESPAGWINTVSPAPVNVQAGVPGERYDNNNFGNFRLGEVSGFKWDDSNVNGIWDVGEKALSGWPTVLYKDGVKAAEMHTNADGSFQFTNLHYGSYSVWEASQTDWRQTHPLSTDFAVPDHVLESGHYEFQIKSGTRLAHKDFGNVALGSIEKIVQHYWWAYLFQDVKVTFEEIDVPGILDNLQDFPETLTTDENGEARVDQLLPGTYKITVELPLGYGEDPPVTEHIFTLSEGEAASVTDRIYDNSSREPRTLGFWKNWGLRYSESEMQALLERVKIASQAFESLDLVEMNRLLTTAGKKTGPEQMEATQYLVLWLNLASERLGFTTEVNLNYVHGWRDVINDNYGVDDGMISIHELMKQLVVLYNNENLTAEQIETIKNICDAINNSQLF